MKKARSVYLVIDHSDKFLLPLGVFDSFSSIARAFDVTPACVYYLLTKHLVSPSLNISVEEICIYD